MTIHEFRKNIEKSTASAKEWFEKNSRLVTRDDFHKKLSDAENGAVYVYVGKDGKIIYVGQTKRRIKARLYDQTSPHKKKPWWVSWENLRYIQLPDEMDRLTLEFLLILAYEPSENKKPRHKAITLLFESIGE